MKINFIPGERMTVIGKAGSGKSHFALNVIRPKLKYRIIYDYKHEIKPLPGEKVFYRPSDFQANPNTPWVIYRPSTGSDQEFNELCNIIYRRGHTTLIIDDMSEHAPVGKIQRAHSDLIRLGRSRECGIVTLTQEPVGVHRLIFSQANHFVIFKTQMKSHREKLAGFMGPKVLEIPEKYHFWYYNEHLDDPIYMQPIKGEEVSLRRGGVL